MPDPTSTVSTRDVGDMSTDEFRTYGHQLVDWIADFLSRIDDVPVTSRVEPGALKNMLPREAPVAGEGMDAILADVDRVIMPAMTHWNHPSFFAYFNSSGSSPGILAELLSAAFNVNCMLWQSCPAGTELEAVTLEWLRTALGLPADFWGTIYDSASSASLHALAAARESMEDLNVREAGIAGRSEVPRLRAYASEQAHSSVQKAALVLGLGRTGLQQIPVDDEFCMRPDALREAIAADRKAGRRPFCVVATVGTTSTTAIDPVPSLARICQDEGLWLHVDAAHAGIAAIVPEYREILRGCEQADSFVVNPHKWMFVPIDLSAFFTRRPDILKRAFSLVPEYLRTEHDAVVENYMDYGVALGRRFRALKLWFVLRYFGIGGLTTRIREHFRLARLFSSWVDQDPNFERVASVPLSTVCFRACPPGVQTIRALNDLNERLLNAVNGTNRVFLTHTKVNDRFVLRVVVSHLRTEERHVRHVWSVLQSELAALVA